MAILSLIRNLFGEDNMSLFGGEKFVYFFGNLNFLEVEKLK